MESPVSPEVAAHVASCPECTKDLSLLKSLLAADGPDSPDTKSASTQEQTPEGEPEQLADAMADGNDSRGPESPPPTEPRGATTDSPASDRAKGASINVAALVAVLVIFVGAAVLAFFALR